MDSCSPPGQRETFCSKSDPQGGTPEQWLADKRGGITENQAKARDVCNARAREKRAQKQKKNKPLQAAPHLRKESARGEKGERELVDTFSPKM